MNNNIENLQSGLKKIDLRLSEMKAQREELGSKAKSAERKFIAGDIDLDDFQAEEFKLNLLDRVIGKLETERAGVDSELAAVIAKEDHQKAVEAAKEAAFEVVSVQKEYEAVRDALNAQIEAFSESLTKLACNWSEAQTALFNRLRAIDPKITSLNTLNLSQSGINSWLDVWAQMRRAGLPDGIEKTATYEQIISGLPELDFEEAVRLVERIGIDREYQERRKFTVYEPKHFAPAAPMQFNDVEKLEKHESSEPVFDAIQPAFN